MPAPVGNQYAKGHGHGRPTIYKPEYVDKVYDFIEECINGKKYVLPSKEGFCNSIEYKDSNGKKRKGVSVITLTNWAQKHEDFLCALEFLERIQKTELINRGLNNEVNTTIAKLMLNCNHGMKEKTEVDVNLSDISSALLAARKRASKDKS